MHEERLQVDHVPARLYDPGSARGLLLFGHGGAHSKDGPRFVQLCRTYAEGTGLAVVCIDAVDHGDRRPVGAGGGAEAAGLPPRWHSSAMDQMVADWQRTAVSLASIGPPLAYVGFSMGMIFGAPTVASMPTIRAAVYGVGGIPAGGGIDDPPLADLLLAAAARHAHPQVLMLNVTDDDIFPLAGTLAFFAAIPTDDKRLVLHPGPHDHWPDEAIAHSLAFLTTHT